MVRDPPFSTLGLISCRNLLIYLAAELQKKLLPLFHYALSPGGYLFLGSSEGVGESAGMFRDVDKQHRLFQRVDTVLRPPVVFPLSEFLPPPGQYLESGKRWERLKTLDVGSVMTRLVLGHAPPGVVINERAEIVYSAGETGQYLQQPTGTPTVNILDLARRGLRASLRRAIRDALKTRAPVIRENVAVRTPTGLRHIDLLVQPLPELSADSGLWAVIFQTASRVQVPAVASLSEESAVQQLELELKTTHQELHTTVEELDAGNEELKWSLGKLSSFKSP